MIIDVHTHAMSYPDHLSDEFVHQADIARGYHINLSVDFDTYMKDMEGVDKCIVFGMKAYHTGFDVPNSWIAAFAARAPEKLIPFMSLDATDPDFMDDFEYSWKDLKLRGVKMAPMYANFDPTDPHLDELYRRTSKLGLPILFHTGTTFCQFAPLKYTRPALWDDIAIRYPDQIMILAHLGHPFENEAIVTARKHPNVYLDLSALYYRPWQLFNSLMLAQEYGVMNKILFGTDYPFTNAEDTILGLNGLNHMVEGTNLPRISQVLLEEIIYRDSLPLLNLS